MIDSNSVDFWRNKHWIVRRNYIREEVENKECKLKYTPTEDMIAVRRSRDSRKELGETIKCTH